MTQKDKLYFLFSGGRLVHGSGDEYFVSNGFVLVKAGTADDCTAVRAKYLDAITSAEPKKLTDDEIAASFEASANRLDAYGCYQVAAKNLRLAAKALRERRKLQEQT